MKPVKKIIFFLFVFALVLRIHSFFPSNIILGFDQIRDLFTARSIWYDHDLKIIGPTAGNSSSLHHGVAFWYYLIPPVILGGGNPFWVSLWGSIINSLSVIAIYFFARSLFKNKIAAFASAFVAAVSHYFVLFSSWIGNPGPTLLTVPLFFYCLWKFIEGNRKYMIYSAFFLGLSIQFELFFIYLILLLPIVLIMFRPKNPGLKFMLYSILSFALATSTMIATEIKYSFAGVREILGAVFSGTSRGAGIAGNFSLMLDGYAKTFEEMLWPGNEMFGKTAAFLIIVLVALKVKNKSFLFLLIYLLSPMVMLLAGFHGAPWFLIGLAPAVALSAGYIISAQKNFLLTIFICMLIFVANFDKGMKLLGADESAILKNQLDAIAYTYESSNKSRFVINSVTNPLYINYPWAYNYQWFGLKKFEYIPSWGGGDQLFPYNTLPKPEGGEKFLYLLIDETPRIPEVHRILARRWADERSKLIETKVFGGITVEKRLFQQ